MRTLTSLTRPMLLRGIALTWLLVGLTSYCNGQCVNGRCYQWGGQRWYSTNGSYQTYYRSTQTTSRVWKQSDAVQITSNAQVQSCLADINAYRAQSGRAPLALDDNMCLFAQRYADRMQGLTHSGGPYAENIGVGYLTGRAAAYGWEHSSGHAKNLLRGSRCGIGYSNIGRRGKWVFVVR